MSAREIIAGLEVQRGKKSVGLLSAGTYFPNAPRNYLRSTIQIPLSVIVGREEGPTLCITAGMDPTEYAAIGAAIALSNSIKPEQVKGTLIIVHVSNILGFWERKYISAVDGVQLPQNFPGKKKGKVTDVMAHRIFTECISKADYYIDLHGSDFPEWMVPNAGYYVTGSEGVDSRSLSIAKASLSDYVLTFNADRDEDLPMSSVAAASFRGIPSALIEMGEGGNFSEDEVSQYFNEVVNILKHLKLIDGEPEVNEKQKVLTSGYVPFVVKTSGLFYLSVKPGDILAENDKVGEVRDLFGKTLEVVRAPSRSLYLGGVRFPVVVAGQDMGMLIPLED